jgi:integrase
VDADIARGVWVSPQATLKELETQNTLEVFLEKHIELQITRDGKPLAETTKEHYRRVAKNHLKSLGKMKIGEIRKADVDLWYANMAKTGKLTTAAKAYTLVFSALKRACDDDLISKNPCAIKGARTASSNRKMDIPDPRAVAKILHAINPKMKLLVVVEAYGGLRWGEATALTRGDLKKVVANGQYVYEINVNKAIKFVNGKFIKGLPKTDYSIRKVEMSVDLTELIDELLDQMVDKTDSALIVKGEKTEYLRHDVFSNNWHRALKRAGLSDKKYTGHTLRHHAGTHYAKAGANLPEVKLWIGDNSTSAVQRYLHTTDRANSLANKMEIDFAVLNPELLEGGLT